jgi:hypothetical protein
LLEGSRVKGEDAVSTTNVAMTSGVLRHGVFALFAAGFVSVLVFQMGAGAILHALDLAGPPFPYDATAPFGVPRTWSFAFFGGLWGIVFGLVEKYFPDGPMYYVCAFLFGAIAPILVLWFVVFPLKGQPIASGWNVPRMLLQMLAHGCFGLGVGILLQACARRAAR